MNLWYPSVKSACVMVYVRLLTSVPSTKTLMESPTAAPLGRSASRLIVLANFVALILLVESVEE